MKKLLLYIILLTSYAAQGQSLFPTINPYVSSSTNYMKQGFVEAKGFLFTVSDTFPAKYPTLIKHPNGKFYTTDGDGAKWVELLAAVGGGGISFNGRTGAIVPQLSDYSSFFAALNHTTAAVDVTGTKTSSFISNFGSAVSANSDVSTSLAHVSATNNPHNTTKAQVGLSNADNTSDANKPISTAQQAALDAKSDLVSPVFSGIPKIGSDTVATKAYSRSVGGTGGSAAVLYNGTGSNTDGAITQAATTTAINLKANSASPTLTGTPIAPTASAGTNTTQIATTAHVFAERSNTATLTNHTINFSQNTASNIPSSALIVTRAKTSTDVVRKDQLDSAAKPYTFRNAVGSGNDLIYFPNDSTAIAKKQIYNGNITQVHTDSTDTYTFGSNIATGTVNFTGNGSTTSFTISLTSVAGLSSTSKVYLTAKTSVGAAIDWVDVSTASITIYYFSAPTSGSKVLNYLIVP